MSAVSYLNCLGCRWRSTWGWHLCQGRREASTCRSPLGLQYPTAPTPPERNQKKIIVRSSRQTAYTYSAWRWNRNRAILLLLLIISVIHSFIYLTSNDIISDEFFSSTETRDYLEYDVWTLRHVVRQSDFPRGQCFKYQEVNNVEIT